MTLRRFCEEHLDSLALAIGALGVVCLLAAWFPARGASRLAPTVALSGVGLNQSQSDQTNCQVPFGDPRRAVRYPVCLRACRTRELLTACRRGNGEPNAR